MLSQLGQEFSARSFIYRAVVAVFILAVTLGVSIIWERMVYTIPVLAVMLFLAAGMKGLSGATERRNLDQESVEIDIDATAGMDAG